MKVPTYLLRLFAEHKKTAWACLLTFTFVKCFGIFIGLAILTIMYNVARLKPPAEYQDFK